MSHRQEEGSIARPPIDSEDPVKDREGLEGMFPSHSVAWKQRALGNPFWDVFT